jgi:hypothetical protein
MPVNSCHQRNEDVNGTNHSVEQKKDRKEETEGQTPTHRVMKKQIL